MLLVLHALPISQSNSILKCCRENKQTSEICSSSFESDFDKDVHQWEDNLRHMSPEEFATSLLSSPLLSENSESNVDKSNEEEIKQLTIPQQTEMDLQHLQLHQYR